MSTIACSWLKEKLFFGGAEIIMLHPDEMARPLGAIAGGSNVSIPLKGVAWPNMTLSAVRSRELGQIADTKAQVARLELSTGMRSINQEPSGWRELPIDKVIIHQLLMMGGLVGNGEHMEKGILNKGELHLGCGCVADTNACSTLVHRALHCAIWQDRRPVVELRQVIGRHADSLRRIGQALAGAIGPSHQRTVLRCRGRIAFPD